MEKTIKINRNYLTVPVYAGTDLIKTRINSVKSGAICFNLPRRGGENLFKAYIPKAILGEEITVSGDIDKESLGCWECVEKRPGKKPCDAPILHYTPSSGWVNDPNGLIFHNGTYHLYHQYNPFGIEWGNMSWGHATSKDLLHWKEENLVMLPDEEGTIFSGCAVSTEDGGITYFYTHAIIDGDGKRAFLQKMAKSHDGGMTLEKVKNWQLGPIKEETRDPKVFFHKETGYHIMVLWEYEDVFTILRSKDLLHWQQTDELRLDKGFECPDLVDLGPFWAFFAADGSYYTGSFDGRRFIQSGGRRDLYLDKSLPYAAQRWEGTKKDAVITAWLRTKCYGHTTGMFSVPMELGAKGDRVTTDFTKNLFSAGDVAYLGSKTTMPIKKDRALLITVEGNAVFGFADHEIRLEDDKIVCDGKVYPKSDGGFPGHVLIDNGIAELHLSGGMDYVCFETGHEEKSVLKAYGEKTFEIKEIG